ncbi:MAG: glucosamine-6-phosphate deaminase [Clostridia bacterium]|nr:glucosamine-6-phosphate deaminase [Clostridia bacterium]
MKTFYKDNLFVTIADTDIQMGEIAANDICQTIKEMISARSELNIIFAAAPSQNTTLDALITKDIPWERINAFHMDEYIGLPIGSPAAFRCYLKDRLFSKVPFRSVHYIDAFSNDKDAECLRYSKLLTDYPVDIVILGIGENGHLAFNDPPVADFNDPVSVKAVLLDDICRMQQVHDGCFTDISQVPHYALTLTIPALMAAKHMFCVVPYTTKAMAVRELLTTEHIDERFPASALRTHTGARLYCEQESASLL